ncbi:hypothetical protein [Chryseobacterium sp.]|uniref:hypothetical protein n=1 Tax=Chryseobacterium sp. TaxID=1871047 RepID=UPI00289D0550|nr:hypothetical protein [Chryseobacterium sp.]
MHNNGKQLDDFFDYLVLKLKLVKIKFPNLVLNESHLIQVIMSSYMDRFELKSSLEIYDISLSNFDIDFAIDNYDFNQITNEFLFEFEIPVDLEELQTKVKIKTKGKVFIIHKNDVDPFPSNPHAHWLDTNLKVDLSNGKCYQVKKHLFTLKNKELLDLRYKANQLGVILPEIE